MCLSERESHKWITAWGRKLNAEQVSCAALKSTNKLPQNWGDWKSRSLEEWQLRTEILGQAGESTLPFAGWDEKLKVGWEADNRSWSCKGMLSSVSPKRTGKGSWNEVKGLDHAITFVTLWYFADHLLHSVLPIQQSRTFSSSDCLPAQGSTLAK